MRNTILQIISEISGGLVERDSIVETMWRALLSRQHILLLGPAGVAKSLVSHVTIERVTGAKFFKRVLRRDSTVDELFGPISLKALEQDIFKRNITGKLPEAHLAFLDECFKCNSTVLNGLLDVINERTFENDGQTTNCPLLSLVGASNEDAQGEELDAFRDRFLVIMVIKDIQEDTAFKKFLQIKTAAVQTGNIPVTLTLQELQDAIKDVKTVTVPDDVLDSITTLRRNLHKIGIYPSPRRFGSCLNYLQAAAWLDGRNVVDCDDLMVLKDCLWQNKDSIPDITKILASLSNPDLGKIMETLDAAKQVFDAASNSSEATIQLEANTKLRAAKVQLEGIGKGTNSPKVKAKAEAGIEKVKTYHATLLKALGMGSL